MQVECGEEGRTTGSQEVSEMERQEGKMKEGGAQKGREAGRQEGTIAI